MQHVVTIAETRHTPESLAAALADAPGLVVLRSALEEPRQGRFSFVAAHPFLIFSSHGTRCEVRANGKSQVQYGNPWQLLDSLLARCEILDQADVPFPLGGCFGYWGYELKDALESCLTRRAVNDLELPDCHLGFYDSLVVFDHMLATTHIISTGSQSDGSRSAEVARVKTDWWMIQLRSKPGETGAATVRETVPRRPSEGIVSTLDHAGYVAAVDAAQNYIRAGHIYQVNLARRLTVETDLQPTQFSRRLQLTSPAPFSAYLDCGRYQIASSSPESFLRLSGRHVRTRPIKGTRPRGADPEADTRLAYELQTSPKEQAELVMITDLLRNDLGRVCAYGSVNVPDLFRLERFSHVQHLVSTVEGELRPEVTHLDALAACFPGGSITGAPKIRAMQIIDELEPVTRGPYTGAIGYLGFNRESQLSIAIRTAVCMNRQVHFHVGAGIVADSDPDLEFEETSAKAQGLLAALDINSAMLNPRRAMRGGRPTTAPMPTAQHPEGPLDRRPSSIRPRVRTREHREPRTKTP